jgi:hypothetical protein
MYINSSLGQNIAVFSLTRWLPLFAVRLLRGYQFPLLSPIIPHLGWHPVNSLPKRIAALQHGLDQPAGAMVPSRSHQQE